MSGRRIALLVPSLRGGGLERVVRDLALDLASLGEHPALFPVAGLGVHAAPLVARGIDVVDCEERGLRIRGYPRRLVRALRRFAPDVIHAHSGTWLPAVVARGVVRPRAGLVYTEHGRYPPEPWRRALVERRLAAATDQIVTVSASVASYLVQFLRLPASPLVIPNGIELAAFSGHDPAARARLRAEWGATPDEAVFVVVGRLAPVKNHAGILRAFAEASGRGAPLRLVILGQGPLDAEIRAQVASLGLGSRVVLAGYRDDSPACLAAADGWVNASTTEGLPIALLEAMAAGLAVVAYAIGGIPDAVGEDGAVLVPPGDERGLAEALYRMASDSTGREALRSSARTRSADYSLRAMTGRYIALYDRLASGQRAAS